MKQLSLIVGLIVLIGLALLAGSSLYVTNETQQVIITRFGKPVGDPVTNPGLHFKVPLFDKVNRFEKRFLEWDGDPNQLPTKDKRFIFVDSYARWRISDPLLYFQRLRDELRAQSRLDDILDGETRNTIAKHNLIEVVRSTNRQMVADVEPGQSDEEVQLTIESGRDVLTAEVLESAKGRVTDLGIEILDFRFKRINYVPEVREEVYARMISERQRIAEQFRSEGAGEAARINGERERELRQISSEAYRESQEIKGRADAEAADIYARAYNKDAEFYRFMKTMEVYKVTVDKETVLMLGTDGEFLRYLERSK